MIDRLDLDDPSSDGWVLGRLRLGGGSCRRGGSGMKLIRTLGGIIMMAGPEPDVDIWPRGVILRPVLTRLIVGVSWLVVML